MNLTVVFLEFFYYVAYPPLGTRPRENINKFHNFLTFLKKGLKFTVSKKPLKTINLRDKDSNLVYDQETGKPRTLEKGNLDVELTIDAIKYSDAYDIAILITGDSDFLSLVSYLRNLSNPKQVFIFSTEGNIFHELKTGGDGYFNIINFSQIHSDKLKKRQDK